MVSSFGTNQLKVLVKVGSVDFQQGDSQGNPVLAYYLQRHGTLQGLTTPLTNGYSLNTPDVTTTFNAPLTNKQYSKTSEDFNPIHVNPYFSDFASLPATITHSYSLNTPDVTTTFNAPLTNKPYSQTSEDFNPIHVNPYFSDFASLPATITHSYS